MKIKGKVRKVLCFNVVSLKVIIKTNFSGRKHPKIKYIP